MFFSSGNEEEDEELYEDDVLEEVPVDGTDPVDDEDNGEFEGIL